jgi:hypothetical protein
MAVNVSFFCFFGVSFEPIQRWKGLKVESFESSTFLFYILEALMCKKTNIVKGVYFCVEVWAKIEKL